MSEFRNVSAHAQPLASGRLIAPGDTANIDLKDKDLDPHDRALVEGGAFVEVETNKKKETRS